MKYSVEDIINFLEDAWGDAKTMHPESDIFNELGIDGDDTDDIIHGYAKKFNVDMSGYLWYFHSGDEATAGNPFKSFPFGRLGGRIPITPQMLADFANKGFWDVDYPNHEFPFKESTATNVARYVMLALIGGLVLFFILYNYTRS